MLALAGGVLTIVAPFNTDAALANGPRALFWTGIVVATYAVGATVHTLLRDRVRGLPPAIGITLIAVVTGLALAAVIDIITGAVFGWPDTLGGIARDVARDFSIGACVSMGFQIAARRAPDAAQAALPATPPLLDRLPLGKRGALVALSVEDHYVRVRTTQGEEMVLMRLSDAIRETGSVPGMQVHRSRWIALDHVRSARRDGDRAILTMTVGAAIPVSRANVPAVRDARLLPK